MDRDVARADDSPAAIGLGATEGRPHVRYRVGHAGSVRYGVKALAFGDRNDLHRLEQDVVAGGEGCAPCGAQ
jgi:hypothetical protein